MIALLLVAAEPVVQNDLGKAEAACRPHESGPAFIVEVDGLRDRVGLLKLEVYPATDADFLSDDSHLVSNGRTFRRVEQPPPATGVPRLCVRVPGPGRYAVSLLHDRDGNHRLTIAGDGVGFASNPKLGWRKPKAASASAIAGFGPTSIKIIMNYRHGLSIRPDDR